MNEKQLQMKREKYVIRKMEEAQESEDFFLRMNELQMQYEEEAKVNVTEESIRREIAEAEKQAALDKKLIPEEQIPAETVKEIEEHYGEVSQGKKLSGKARKKIMREYKKKKKTVETARNIKTSFDSFDNNMKDELLNCVKNIDGDMNSMRKALSMATYASVFTGDSMMMNVEMVRDLSIDVVDTKNAPTQEQKERWIYAQEKLFNVIMQYDLKKLKYNNTDEFLKNLATNQAITSLAFEMQKSVPHYRELANQGKINDPLSPRLLNELEARINILLGLHGTIAAKAKMMQSDLYMMLDHDTVSKMTEDDMQDASLNQEYKAIDESLPEEVRKKAAVNNDYYKAMLDLHYLKVSGARFNRGDDPEKLLDAERKKINKAHPVGGDNELSDIKSAGVKVYIDKLQNKLDNHSRPVKNARSKLPQGQNYGAIDFIKTTKMENWKVLLENPKLRRREIKRYYSQMHRGRQIPPEVLERIESKFEERYQRGLKFNNDGMTEADREHDKFRGDFWSRYPEFTQTRVVKDGEGTHEITETVQAIKVTEVDEKGEKHERKFSKDRNANAVLGVYHGASEEEQERGYVAFYRLYHDNVRDYIPELCTDKKKKELVEKRRKEVIDYNKPLIDFVMDFDLNKLVFNDPIELMSRQKEITSYIQVVGDIQFLAMRLYRFGALSDDEFLDMQARIDMVMNFNGIFQNLVPSENNMMGALLDEEDLQAYMNGDSEEMELDKEYFEDDLQGYEICFELDQYIKLRSNMDTMWSGALFKQGEKLESILPKYRSNAEKKLKEAKADFAKDRAA